MKVGNFLIWGIIESILKVAARIVYTVFSFFHLLPLFIYCAVGGLVHLIWNVLEKGSVFFTIFHVIAGVLCLYAVIATILSILGVGRRKKRKEKSSVEIVERGESEDEEEDYEEEIVLPSVKKKAEKYIEPIKDEEEINYPLISKVKQNPDYVMAEYEDRYELYYKTDRGYRYIRTDYKENQGEG